MKLNFRLQDEVYHQIKASLAEAIICQKILVSKQLRADPNQKNQPTTKKSIKQLVKLFDFGERSFRKSKIKLESRLRVL
jgi:DNA-binding transcriptional regulator YhcF (GntR family)